MSLSAVEALLLADCPPAWKVVLMVIAKHGRGLNGNGGRPGLRRIARLAGIGRSTLVEILALLEAKGWLTWIKGSAKKHRANAYTIRFEAIPIHNWVGNLTSKESELGQNLDQSEIWTRPESELVQKEALTRPESGPEASTEANTSTRTLFAKDEPSQAKSPRKKKSIKETTEEKPPDPRHTPIRKAWERHYAEQVKRPPPKWNGHEAKALSQFLDDNSTLTVADFDTILANRARSPGITHTYRLSQWINRYALSWLDGLADDWGHTITGGKPNGITTPESKQSKIDSAFEQVRTKLRGVDTPRVEGHRNPDGADRQPGANRTDGG